MTVYVSGHITIHDRDEYAMYEAGFMEVFQQFNGSILAVDESPVTLEGTWSATRFVRLPDNRQTSLCSQQNGRHHLSGYRRSGTSVAVHMPCPPAANSCLERKSDVRARDCRKRACHGRGQGR